MFESIRKHQRLLQFILLLLIVPAFAFFGISGYDSFFSGGDAVATVDDVPITRQDFDAAQRQQIEQMRNALGASFDPAMLEGESARKQIVEGLVVQQTLAWAARKNLIAVSDEELRDLLNSIPGMQDSNGKFDRERYRALLAARGLSEAGFEYEQRQELALRALPESIGRSAAVSSATAERLLRASEQMRTIEIRRFQAADFVSKTGNSAADFKAYFDAHPDEFEIPESATVDYLVLSAKDVEAGIELDPKAVRSYYDQNPQSYGKPEQRQASHILLTAPAGDTAARDKARAQAQTLLERIRSGEDFAAIAKTQSQDPASSSQGGDLGMFARDGMVEAIAAAAFEIAAPGDVSEPVASEFGWHLIKLTAIQKPELQPFEDVREGIEKSLRAQQARLRFGEMAETFSNMVYEQADSLEPAAKKFGIKVQRAEGVQRQGSPVLGSESPLNKPQILRAVFSAESVSRRQNTEAIDIGNSTLVSARIVEYSPVRQPDFTQVEAEVAARVKAKEATDLAQAAGQAHLKRLLDGSVKPSEFEARQQISRMGAAGIPAQAVRDIFAVSEEKLPAYVGAKLGSAYAIYQLSKVENPDDKKIAERLDAFRAQIEQAYGQARLAAYFESLKSEAGVELHLERLGSTRAESN